MSIHSTVAPGGLSSLRTRRRKGFVMVMMALCMVMLLGAFGLVFDIGRALIAKNEAQAFTDAAALAATIHLNGTNSGVTNAKNAVTQTSNRWMMGTKPFTSVTTEFSPNKILWETNPSDVANVKYVRVTAPTNFVTMHMLSVTGVPKRMNAPAYSVAGFQLPSSFPQGVFPFAPLAKSSVKPDFGYKKGDELTLLWPSSVGSDGNSVKLNNLCAADRNAAALQAVKEGSTSERGYIMENSADAIREAIEDDHMNYTVAEGQVVDRTTGVKHTDVSTSLADRVAQDSDPFTADYDLYVAKHDASPMRRIVIVPIIDGAVTAKVVGFVKVFLPPSQPKNPNDSKCAMYVGPADLPPGHLGTGGNMVRLFQ